MNEITQGRLKRVRHKLSSQGVLLRPISETAIVQFETDHNIRLPSQYRMFLTTVGDGCEAPPGAMYKLDDTITSQARPAEPFPFSQHWVCEGDESVGPSEFARLDCGNLVLVDEGCGISWRIIVTGPERGQMWWFTGQGIQPCAPRRNFLDWLEYWLGRNKGTKQRGRESFLATLKKTPVPFVAPPSPLLLPGVADRAIHMMNRSTKTRQESSNAI
jgi:hypothetical protein